MASSSKKRKTVFKKKYTEEFTVIKASSKSESHAFCSLCSAHFNIASGGRTDVVNHLSSAKHKSFVEMNNGCQSVTKFFTQNENSVINAEVLFTQHLIRCNAPLTMADGFGDVLRKMVPDSAIAKKYGCARTKTTAIVRTLAKEEVEITSDLLKKYTYSIATDGSNDKSEQLYPLVARVYSPNSGKVITTLLGICETNGSSAKNIYSVLKEKLDDLAIPLENCISFSSDNANVMIGSKGGVISHLQSQNDSIILSPCICHLLHLMAKKACGELPVSIDGILIDIYYFFQHSSKRKREFKEFQILFNDETREILRFCPTRWLSLQVCLLRIVDLWKPLSHFMNSELTKLEKKIEKKEKSSKKAAGPEGFIHAVFPDTADSVAEGTKKVSYKHQRLIRITTFLKSKRAAVYCRFLLWFLPSVDNLNKKFQSNEPLVHITNKLLNNFLRDVLSRFMKSSVLADAKDLRSIDYKTEANHLAKSELFIGSDSRIEKLNQNGRSEVFTCVKAFYIKAVTYILEKFPIDSELFRNAEVADVQNRTDSTWGQLHFFISRVHQTVQSIDNVHSGFRRYQSFPLPVEITQSDVFWHHLKSWRDVDGTYPYHDLACVMLGILSIFHSNADSERIFSMVRKVRTDSRASMSVPTLEALLINKMGVGVQLTDSVLTKCKKATMDFLRK